MEDGKLHRGELLVDGWILWIHGLRRFEKIKEENLD